MLNAQHVFLYIHMNGPPHTGSIMGQHKTQSASWDFRLIVTTYPGRMLIFPCFIHLLYTRSLKRATLQTV